MPLDGTQNMSFDGDYVGDLIVDGNEDEGHVPEGTDPRTLVGIEPTCFSDCSASLSSQQLQCHCLKPDVNYISAIQ